MADEKCDGIEHYFYLNTLHYVIFILQCLLLVSHTIYCGNLLDVFIREARVFFKLSSHPAKVFHWSQKQHRKKISPLTFRVFFGGPKFPTLWKNTQTTQKFIQSHIFNFIVWNFARDLLQQPSIRERNLVKFWQMVRISSLLFYFL